MKTTEFLSFDSWVNYSLLCFRYSLPLFVFAFVSGFVVEEGRDVFFRRLVLSPVGINPWLF